MSKLIKSGAFAEDNFTSVADDAALPDGGAIVSLTRFQKERASLLERNAPLGVRLDSSQSPELLGEDVNRLSLVVLDFPKFRDGRAFSWARMLRTRLGFKGEIRAVGDFLYDQVNYQHRVGFDAWEVPEDFTLAQFQRALAEMTNVYQPSADGKKDHPRTARRQIATEALSIFFCRRAPVSAPWSCPPSPAHAQRAGGEVARSTQPACGRRVRRAEGGNEHSMNGENFIWVAAYSGSEWLPAALSWAVARGSFQCRRLSCPLSRPWPFCGAAATALIAGNADAQAAAQTGDGRDDDPRAPARRQHRGGAW